MNTAKCYKLVPVEPTHEMIAALKARITTTSRGGLLACGAALADAIQAAPTPPQPIYDEAKERELFMSEYPLPSGCQWSEEHQNFGWVKKSAFQRVVTYRALWSGWKACAQSRAKAGEVGDE